jgi:hypothetical protein
MDDDEGEGRECNGEIFAADWKLTFLSSVFGTT